MGAGRNFILLGFPILGTIVAIVLTIIVVLGGRTSALEDLYFFKLDLSNISTSAVSGELSQLGLSSSAVDDVIRDALGTAGIAQFYTTNLWGYCQGPAESSSVVNSTISKCTAPKALWWMNITEILDDSLSSDSLTITLPEEITKYNGTIEAVSKAMFICYFASIGILGITLFAGLFTFKSRSASCCCALLAFVGTLASLLSSGLATGMYAVVMSQFNNNTSEYGMHASLGSKMLGLTWGATASALWGFLWWIFTMCCGSTRRSRDDPEKEPFIGYVPTSH